MIKNKLSLGIVIAVLLEFSAITAFILYQKYIYTHPKSHDKVEIYVVYHKPAPLVKNEVLIPIRAGKALKTPAGEAIPDEMIGDDTGFHISDKNERYSELTVLYWIWKNSKADIVGLMHYRRFLELNQEGITLPAGDNPMENFHGLQKDNILKYMQKYDVIVPEKWEQEVGSNIYEQYKFQNYIEDLYVVMLYIRHKYPKMGDAFEKYLQQKKWSGSNIFIAKKEVIDEYCAWLFDVLFNVDADLDIHHEYFDHDQRYHPTHYLYQRRAPGFIAERLFSFWLDFNSDKYKIKYVPRVVYMPQKTEN